MGIKWNFRKSTRPLSVPALSASLYIEFPTGDASQELGSGLTDYWLNSIAQEPFTDKTRLNANFGFLFAGNTSTGVLGTRNTRGHVYTGGLSLLHDFSPRLTLGAEAYGAVANDKSLGKDQLQALAGGWYQLNSRSPSPSPSSAAATLPAPNRRTNRLRSRLPPAPRKTPHRNTLNAIPRRLTPAS